MPSFAIDLGTLRPGHTQVELEAGAQDLDLPADQWIGPVRGRFGVERTGDRISVRGTLEARERLECVRCLEVFERPVEVPFELFADRAGSGRRLEEEALERDSYMKFHDGRRLDLAPDAREVLLLESPMVPLCREDCLGLCPRCGANLNLGPCDCPKP